jgi:D-inositol-3-phosphate glycosyltransferase
MISNSHKRIALISVHGDPAIEIGKEEAGGQNVYVRHVGEALAQLGWKVEMFTRKISGEQDTIVEHSENCHTIRLQAGALEFVPRDNLFGYLPEFVANFRKYQKENDFVYPLIHTNYWLSSWVGMELKKIQGSKQVHTYHSIGAVKYNTVADIPLIATTRLAVEKQLLETANMVVATSPQEKEHMRSLISSKGKIDIIPCGTDVRHYGRLDQKTAKAKLKIDDDTKVVLYVGRFDQRKGIETLVRAFAQSQLRGKTKLRLIIAGGSRPGHSDGIERERIEKIIAELGIGNMVILPGRLGQEVLPAYYTAADVCVVPSHYEPFGLVAIEAMACGTPVVASDVGGLQFTVIPGKTGLLAPPEDVTAFANAIDKILISCDWRDLLGAQAKQRVNDMFSWDGVASQLADLYTQLLQQESVKEPMLLTK